MSCRRTWEVAAARDGRLGKKARLDHERHLARCDECEREREALDGVQAQLRAAPVRDVDALALRRLRSRTLEAAHAATVHRSARGRSSRLVLSLAAAAVIVAIAGAWHQLRTPPPETRVVATDEGDARWTMEERDAVRHVHVHDGALAVWVDRPAGGNPVVVHVPDGEIEDTGTIFHVAVAGGRTQRVHVDEGSVVVRLRGQAARTLRAGETWELAAPVVSAPAPAPCAAPVASPVAPATSVAPPRALPAPASSEPPVSPALPASPAPPPVIDTADEEDRAYVEIVRLLREGRERDARAAALDYSRRFPAGFRRAEVDRVLGAR